jgi:hypothetical protein
MGQVHLPLYLSFVDLLFTEANDSFVGLIKEKYIQPNPILMITNRCAQGEILLARMYFARQTR